METRREFLKSATAVGIASVMGMPVVNSAKQTGTIPAINPTDRSYWLEVLEKIAAPVLQNLSRGELKKNMPVEANDPKVRSQYTHLEAFGRLASGIAPWLAATGTDDSENARQKSIADLVRASLDKATNTSSPDFMNFCHGGQPLVDSAYLVKAILYAPSILWEPLEPRVKRQVVAALKSSRQIFTPTANNWVMFAAMVEMGLHFMGEETIPERLEDCVQRMLGWYQGDGIYGDGEPFHWDYYNSFVIHPMLLDTLKVLKEKNNLYEALYNTELVRARRYAQILERLIAPDGTFPSIGRSTTYRFGAFQLLGQMALMKQLPEQIKPAQVRCAMTAVIRKMIEAPGTFDENGWLQIGFYGHQPTLAEAYISTGSLYLCAAGLLPLGLPPDDEFWSGAAMPWTSQQIWSGQLLPADHAINQ